jgi:hypothetical protein
MPQTIWVWIWNRSSSAVGRLPPYLLKKTMPTGLDPDRRRLKSVQLFPIFTLKENRAHLDWHSSFFRDNTIFIVF